MAKKIIIANWKMLPATLGEAKEILEFTSNYLENLSDQNFSLVMCPPFIYTEEVSKVFVSTSFGGRASLGAQDIAPEDSGALTGEISGPMLKRLNVRYVIIGHSERRWKLGESEETVNKKLRTAILNEMIPVVCIGERSRDNNYEAFIENQVKSTFAGMTDIDVDRCIIAYEPVWAISTNPDAKPDTPESATESIKLLRKIINKNWPEASPKFIYGGSVTEVNAKSFLEQTEIEGVLVGGASVRKEEFVSILSQAR